ncbi:hypothetical protein [Sphingomonas sp.]|uniref:hypothetical protein n=1 Tax=Sphingomonas sp. TaxID=28214 RepID=UPI003B3B6D50
MRVVAATMTTMALLLAGCGEKTPVLPTEPLDRAAACGVLEAGSAREALGMKGELPAEAQARVLHYAMLYASEGGSFDRTKFNAVSKRMPTLSDSLLKGKWQTLRPACASAYPPAQIATPTLPPKPLDAMLQCYTMADFLRTASTGTEDRYGLLTSKLDSKMTPALRAAGIANGDALTARKNSALAAAAQLGQPVAVIKACEAKFGG